MASTALLVCLASTWFMTGLIWMVQIVHYPLFDRVSIETFREYHARHVRLIGPIAASAMTAELGSSVILVITRPEGISISLAIVGLIFAVLTWLSTILVQVPLHNQLSRGINVAAHRTLVQSNWVRTAAWTLHALLLLIMTAHAIG